MQIVGRRFLGIELRAEDVFLYYLVNVSKNCLPERWSDLGDHLESIHGQLDAELSTVTEIFWGRHAILVQVGLQEVLESEEWRFEFMKLLALEFFDELRSEQMLLQ